MTFTYPHLGNYGVNPFDFESDRLQVAGVVCREYSQTYSNWRATTSLSAQMQLSALLGIEGVDTRCLVRILRSEGVMRAVISAKGKSDAELVEQARAIPSMEGLDLTGTVSCSSAYDWHSNAGEPLEQEALGVSGRRFRVAALDFGIKKNILRRLHKHGCDVRVFPGRTSAAEVLEWNPDGVFLSNGPGDPAATTYALATIREIAPQKPCFGICLGHQLIGLAFGAKTYKLKFGHRGANHPVKNLLTGAIEISSQNHGFAVDVSSLPDSLEATHVNLNDGTLSGLRHKELPLFCVQYHPEASPGPHDSDYLFADFRALMSRS